VFGAVLAAKLVPRGLTPHDYLRERVLEPLGCEVASWRKLRDGTQPLPTGAFLSARAWATYGSFFAGDRAARRDPVLRAESIADCLVGSVANPRYGLGWWLSPFPREPDIFYASGAGGQALYVFPTRRIAVVKFAKRGASSHPAFLRRLIGE